MSERIITPNRANVGTMIMPCSDLVDSSKDIDDEEADIHRIIGNANIDSEDLQKLQAYIDGLKSRVDHSKTPHHKVQHGFRKLYRVYPTASRHDPVTKKLFLDPPVWTDSNGEKACRFRCSRPIHNLDLYLERNKDVAFLVYYDFHEALPPMDVDFKPARDCPKARTESIRPINRNLIAALDLLRDKEAYSSLLGEGRFSGEIAAPYLFVYHCREDLENILRELPDDAASQLAALLSFIRQEYNTVYAGVDEMFARGKVSPSTIPFLFRPGQMVISHDGDDYRGHMSRGLLSRLNSKIVAEAQPPAKPNSNTGPSCIVSDDNRTITYDINVWNWDFDGCFQRHNRVLMLRLPLTDSDADYIQNRYTSRDFDIGPEQGAAIYERNITDLNIYPIQFAVPDLLDKLRRRGQTFWSCRNRKLISYRDLGSSSIETLVEERYMVDVKTYQTLHVKYGTSYTSALSSEVLARDAPPDQDFLLLVPPFIKGYNLRRKKWVDLTVDRISAVTWNKDAFKKLVINAKSRDLLEALITPKVAANKATDLIAGKGNGLILLLHGGLGTGKTLTAESVAELAEKPLYRVTCGELGTQPDKLEASLESVLHLGKIWNCVVLLDEADVFLERRSLEDLTRNALVSVFLRGLEYYEGTLILTSNRVGTFDEAFKSRIHLALHYPPLGEYQRLRIWDMFIDRLESFRDDTNDTDDLREHLQELKEVKMDGREIRNTITLARQHADWKKQKMTYQHLKHVIEISRKFDEYLNGLNDGYTQDQLAKDDGLR